jgi:hypothetical protein
MNELGLAQAGAGQQAEPMRNINQIVSMLMQGVSPDQLVAQGVPQELVMEAMRIVQQEITEVPEDQAGLAGMVTK